MFRKYGIYLICELMESLLQSYSVLIFDTGINVKPQHLPSDIFKIHIFCVVGEISNQSKNICCMIKRQFRINPRLQKGHNMAKFS